MGLLRKRGTRVPSGEDFRHLTSVEDARQAVEQGLLDRFLLFPAELGGDERPENVVYVPHGRLEETRRAFLRRAASDLKAGFTYEAVPSWFESCPVPAVITFVATGDAGQRLESRIDIWNPGR